jgi:hypothetical protein
VAQSFTIRFLRILGVSAVKKSFLQWTLDVSCHGESLHHFHT